MNDPYLLLWLEAPLQAWGHDSKFGRRDTLDFPTKSGVIGLLCCAQGISEAPEAWLSSCGALDMQSVSYMRKDERRKEIQRQPMLMDFQMVGAGYNDQDPWESLLVPRTSLGKKAVGGGTKMTYRYYLQDMAFAVALQIPKKSAEDIQKALQSPVWDMYLGRKNCIPTEFIYQGLFDSSEAALSRGEELAQEKQLAAYAHVLEGQHDGEVLELNDVPVQSGSRKRYRDRFVTVQKL